MWTVAAILCSLLALSATTAGMIVNGEKRLICLLQRNIEAKCNLRINIPSITIKGQITSERKTYEHEDFQEMLPKMNTAPIFLCKGPACVMNFIEKSKENVKRTGGNEEQKENTFYSGW